MSNTFKKISLAFLGLILPTTLSSCSSGDTSFYMANYHSYMSSDLLSSLENGTASSSLLVNGFQKDVVVKDFKYRTFATNEDLERNFETNYDLAVPSMYLIAKWANQGKVLTLDWSKFGLKNKDGSLITTASQAMNLFTKETQDVLKAYDLSEAYKISNSYGEYVSEDAGLLNYCVPYFMQNFMLGYKSTNNWNPNNLSLHWDEIIDLLKENISNNKINKVAAIEDYRMLYSIARLIEDRRNGVVNTTVNPNVNGDGYVDDNDNTKFLTQYTTKISRETFEKTFEYLSLSSIKNKYFLSDDSNKVLNEFANPNGSQAIMSFNGDLLFGTQGGDDYTYDPSDPSTADTFMNWFKSFYHNDFDIKAIKPQRTLALLDAMTVNRQRVTKNNHIETAYSVLKKVGLEGADHKLYEYDTDTKDSYTYNQNQLEDQPIFFQEDNQYIYGPMVNFDYMQYTSPLQTLNEFVTNSVGKPTDSRFGYFNLRYQNIKNRFTNQEYENYIDTLRLIYSLDNSNISKNDLMRNVTDLHKSDMYYAFMNVKNNYF